MASYTSIEGEMMGVHTRVGIGLYPTIIKEGELTGIMVNEDQTFPNPFSDEEEQISSSQLILESYWRFIHLAWISDYPDERRNVSFEDYMQEKVPVGEGNIEVNAYNDDPAIPAHERLRYDLREFDPRDGVTVVFSDRYQDLRLKYTTDSGVQFSLTPDGLVIEKTFISERLGSYSEQWKKGVITTNILFHGLARLTHADNLVDYNGQVAIHAQEDTDSEVYEGQNKIQHAIGDSQVASEASLLTIKQ